MQQHLDRVRREPGANRRETEDRAIVSMHDRGVPFTRIAAALDLSALTVVRRYHAHGNRPRRATTRPLRGLRDARPHEVLAMAAVELRRGRPRETLVIAPGDDGERVFVGALRRDGTRRAWQAVNADGTVLGETA